MDAITQPPEPQPALTKAERAARYEAHVRAKHCITTRRGKPLVLRDDGRWAREDTGIVVCGAKTRPGDPCPTESLLPNGRCRMHGGKTPAGVAAAGYKGGYSRALQNKPVLREKYERFLDSPDPISLRDDIVVVTAKIEEALEAASIGSAAALPGALAAFEEAVASRDAVRIKGAFDQMKRAVEGAVNEEQSWRKVLDLQRHKGRLARAEHLHVIANATMVDAASAWALVHAFIDLVKTHVPDPAVRRAIATGVTRLVGQGEKTLPAVAEK